MSATVVLRPTRSQQLALLGGRRVRQNPFPPWPCVGEEEISAAVAVLRSGKLNYWTGEQGRAFENEFASSVNCRHAVAVGNGSVALEAALHALGLGPGDEVVVPSRTFIASATCVVMRGAIPVFADVDRTTQNITVDSIRAVLSRKTKAIIAVHLAGWPCDMDAILLLAHEHGLRVIEDCAQAQGATYKGRPVGSIGDAAAFSFCQDKIMSTAGEGGMLTTNDDVVWERAWSFKDHGRNYQASIGASPSTAFRWIHDSCGTNWRLTEAQAAIGRVLLRTLPQQVAMRRENARILSRHFVSVPGLRLTTPPAEIGNAYYKYYAFIRPESLLPSWNRDRIIAAITAEGIPCFSGTCSEVYLEKAFPFTMRPACRLPVARELGDTSLMFLVHPTLKQEDLVDTYLAVAKVMAAATDHAVAQKMAS